VCGCPVPDPNSDEIETESMLNSVRERDKELDPSGLPHTEPLLSRFESLLSGRGMWPYCIVCSLDHYLHLVVGSSGDNS